MSSTTASSKGNGDLVAMWLLGALGLLVVVAAVLAVTVLSPESRALRKCDAAIRATLKAPATYRRISSGGGVYGAASYEVTYDAENSFGVPLRSTGRCRVTGDSASWDEEGG